MSTLSARVVPDRRHRARIAVTVGPGPERGRPALGVMLGFGIGAALWLMSFIALGLF